MNQKLKQNNNKNNEPAVNYISVLGKPHSLTIARNPNSKVTRNTFKIRIFGLHQIDNSVIIN